VGERPGEVWRRRLYHLGRHPIAWGRYLVAHELRRRDVLFGMNPRFLDWRPMYRVARPALLRLTGRPPSELDGYFAEILPLQRSLYRDVARLPSAGAMMQAPLLYVLVRAVRPGCVVETGVSSGYSARLLLEALRRNDSGRLWSIGIQKIAVGAMDAAQADQVRARPVGWLVPPELRSRWELRVGPSEALLGEVLAREARPLSVFIHDSLHHYDTMLSEYTQAWPYLPAGGYLLSHDIHNNRAWPDFLARERLAGDEELDRDLGAVRRPAAA
jgi:hypothetical protein